MRAYAPYSLITFSSNPWFNCACSSSAISDREGALRPYQTSSELTHPTFVSGRNGCSTKIGRGRSSFHQRKMDMLNSSLTEKYLWSLPKKISNFCNSNFPSLISLDDSIACSPTDKANFFGSYFSANSSLSNSSAPDPPTQPLTNPIPSIIICVHIVCRCFVP